jgi:hypothetical protein
MRGERPCNRRRISSGGETSAKADGLGAIDAWVEGRPSLSRRDVGAPDVRESRAATRSRPRPRPEGLHVVPVGVSQAAPSFGAASCCGESLPRGRWGPPRPRSAAGPLPYVRGSRPVSVGEEERKVLRHTASYPARSVLILSRRPAINWSCPPPGRPSSPPGNTPITSLSPAGTLSTGE